MYYYYYYYYRKKRFRWRNVKILQGHLTNAKNSDKTRVWRKVRTEYLSDAVVGRCTVNCKPISCTIQTLVNCAQTTTSYTASKPTLHTSSSLTFLTRLIFCTVSPLAPTSWQWITKPNFKWHRFHNPYVL